MYKIETHLHTTYISHCGWLGAQAIMKAYSAAGYDAICVTDHYNRDTFDYIEMDLSTPGSKTRDFLLGYHRLKREGEKYGIRVYAGAELRFDGSPNDYLLYGFHDELLADLEGKVQKVPLPQQVLQGFAARAALGQHLQAGGFLGGGAVVQPVVTACHKCIQLRRIKAGIGHPGHHQPGAKFLISSVHQRASS